MSRVRYYAYRLAAFLATGSGLVMLADRIMHLLTGTGHGAAGW